MIRPRGSSIKNISAFMLFSSNLSFMLLAWHHPDGLSPGFFGHNVHQIFLDYDARRVFVCSSSGLRLSEHAGASSLLSSSPFSVISGVTAARPPVGAAADHANFVIAF